MQLKTFAEFRSDFGDLRNFSYKITVSKDNRTVFLIFYHTYVKFRKSPKPHTTEMFGNPGCAFILPMAEIFGNYIKFMLTTRCIVRNLWRCIVRNLWRILSWKLPGIWSIPSMKSVTVVVLIVAAQYALLLVQSIRAGTPKTHRKWCRLNLILGT